MRVQVAFGMVSAWLIVVLLALGGFPSQARAYDRKADRQNYVSVDVLPVQLVPGQSAKFQVSMNTHSVPLTQDMAAVSRLRDDQGREYSPVSWKGSPGGGHHRRGVLEFPTLEGNPKSVTLTISKIAGVSERTFQWKVER